MMARPLSLDLRQRVSDALAGGMTVWAAALRFEMRISLNWDSGFRKSRTCVSLSRGQRMRSISGCLIAVTGD